MDVYLEFGKRCLFLPSLPSFLSLSLLLLPLLLLKKKKKKKNSGSLPQRSGCPKGLFDLCLAIRQEQDRALDRFLPMLTEGEVRKGQKLDKHPHKHRKIQKPCMQTPRCRLLVQLLDQSMIRERDMHVECEVWFESPAAGMLRQSR